MILLLLFFNLAHAMDSLDSYQASEKDYYYLYPMNYITQEIHNKSLSTSDNLTDTQKTKCKFIQHTNGLFQRKNLLTLPSHSITLYNIQPIDSNPTKITQIFTHDNAYWFDTNEIEKMRFFYDASFVKKITNKNSYNPWYFICDYWKMDVREKKAYGHYLYHHYNLQSSNFLPLIIAIPLTFFNLIKNPAINSMIFKGSLVLSLLLWIYQRSFVMYGAKVRPLQRNLDLKTFKN